MGIGVFLQREGGITYFVDIIVAGHKLHRFSFLKDFHYLTFELALVADLTDEQFSISPFLQTGKEIEATHPDCIIIVAINHGDTSEFWRMDDAPPGSVVVKQSVKVGYVYRTVLANLNVEVTVVSAILRRREITDLWQTLRFCR